MVGRVVWVSFTCDFSQYSREMCDDRQLVDLSSEACRGAMECVSVVYHSVMDGGMDTKCEVTEKAIE